MTIDENGLNEATRVYANMYNNRHTDARDAAKQIIEAYEAVKVPEQPLSGNPSLVEGYYLPKGHPDHPFTAQQPVDISIDECREAAIDATTKSPFAKHVDKHSIEYIARCAINAYRSVTSNVSAINEAEIRTKMEQLPPPDYTGMVDFTDNVIDMLRPYLNLSAPKRESGGWQPMETAPKDGTPVILFATRFGWKAKASRIIGAFHAGAWRIYGAAQGEPSNDRKHGVTSVQWLDEVEPTKWMPLPKSPTTHIEGGK